MSFTITSFDDKYRKKANVVIYNDNILLNHAGLDIEKPFLMAEVKNLDNSIPFKKRWLKTLFIEIKSFENIPEILKVLEQKNIEIVDLLVDSINETLINDISNYLEDSELSVRLVTSSEELISNNFIILEKYNVHILKKATPDYEQKRVVVRRKAKKLCIDANGTSKLSPYQKVEVPIELEESFKEKLFRFLNRTNRSNSDIYNAGNMSRKLFSKVLCGNVIPKKTTILCLIIGLELNIDDALDLLNAAGYTLSKSLRTDRIVRAFIEIGNYNYIDINDELEKCGELPLGWKCRQE